MTGTEFPIPLGQPGKPFVGFSINDRVNSEQEQQKAAEVMNGLRLQGRT